MDRRSLLGLAGLGLVAPALPTWLRAGFRLQEHGHDADDPDAPHCPNPFVRSTLDRAAVLGKPTLVFVVPEDGASWWERQGAFGQFLNLCSPKALLDLALCEGLCAQQSDLAVHVPAVAKSQDPLLILVEPDGSHRAAAGSLPEVSVARLGLNEKKFEREVRRRVRALEARVRALVAPDASALSRHADGTRTALTPERAEAVEAALAAGRLPEPESADDVAALVRLHSGQEPFDSAPVRVLLEQASFRLREGPPFGAAWASSTGCGSRVESIPDGHPAAQGPPPAESLLYACGMASVPAIGRRFLRFWGAPGGD